MNSFAYKLLRATSVLILVVAICFFLRALIFIMPGRDLPVTDKAHQIVGEVWIPYDSREDLKIFGLLIGVSGLQLWAIWALGKKHGHRDA